MQEDLENLAEKGKVFASDAYTYAKTDMVGDAKNLAHGVKKAAVGAYNLAEDVVELS